MSLSFVIYDNYVLLFTKRLILSNNLTGEKHRTKKKKVYYKLATSSLNVAQLQLYMPIYSLFAVMEASIIILLLPTPIWGFGKLLYNLAEQVQRVEAALSNNWPQDYWVPKLAS